MEIHLCNPIFPPGEEPEVSNNIDLFKNLPDQNADTSSDEQKETPTLPEQ